MGEPRGGAAVLPRRPQARRRSGHEAVRGGVGGVQVQPHGEEGHQHVGGASRVGDAPAADQVGGSLLHGLRRQGGRRRPLDAGHHRPRVRRALLLVGKVQRAVAERVAGCGVGDEAEHGPPRPRPRLARNAQHAAAGQRGHDARVGGRALGGRGAPERHQAARSALVVAKDGRDWAQRQRRHRGRHFPRPGPSSLNLRILLALGQCRRQVGRKGSVFLLLRQPPLSRCLLFAPGLRVTGTGSIGPTLGVRMLRASICPRLGRWGRCRSRSRGGHFGLDGASLSARVPNFFAVLSSPAIVRGGDRPLVAPIA